MTTGKGIYLASEHSKSAAYVRCGKLKSKSIGVMFLAEAALGKAHSIMRDDPSLVTPPKGQPPRCMATALLSALCGRKCSTVTKELNLRMACADTRRWHALGMWVQRFRSGLMSCVCSLRQATTAWWRVAGGSRTPAAMPPSNWTASPSPCPR